MYPTSVSKTIKLANQQEIIIETGNLARQANGSVVIKIGKAMLLATAVTKKEVEGNFDFLPLYVDYQEKFASAGKIPGGFLKREGRLSDYEILISRLVDRAIRPLFPPDFFAETQLNITLISADETILPDTLAALAASSALLVSDIPFTTPVSEVRVAKINGKLVINPTTTEIKQAESNLIVGATASHVLMIEGEMNECSEYEMLEAIQFAHEVIKEHCSVQQSLMEEVNCNKKDYNHIEKNEKFRSLLFEQLYDKVYEVGKKNINHKKKRQEAFKNIKENYLNDFPENQEVDHFLFNQYFYEITKKAARNLIFDKSIRLDGRKPDQIRPITSSIDYLPSAHGSAIFTRGETQSLTTVTLGNKFDEQIIDRPMNSGYNKFILHYNFPGFSTGEVKPNRGPSRREIGHGNLAMRALKKILPNSIDNPYTIRIVSDILESNGSSSMATVCASSLALMDAGVKITAPVSGIAMGLIIDNETNKYVILSDILGDEDQIGDMDLKIAGTELGITACQMDIKIAGLSYEILKEALEKAKKGRLHILKEMSKTINRSNEDYKQNVPRTKILSIDKDMIGTLIGPGGKTIQEIQKETESTIIIEEIDGKNVVKIFALQKDMVDKAEKKVKALITKPAIGNVYTGKIKTIREFGAFVEFLPGKDGLLHISEVKWERIDNLEEVLEVGEEITVKLINIDHKTGKYKLSRKVLIPKSEEKNK